MRPSLEDFVKECDVIVKKLARQLMSQYSGWFKEPDNELDDLMQVGRLRLVTIYSRVESQHDGYKSFVYQSIRGVMLNYIGKNIPNISSTIFIQQVPMDSELNNLPSTDEFDADVYLDSLILKNKMLSIMTAFMSTLSSREQLILVFKICDKKTDLEISNYLGGGRSHITEKFNDLVRKLVRYVKQQQGWNIEVSDMKSYLKESEFGVLGL